LLSQIRDELKRIADALESKTGNDSYYDEDYSGEYVE
jgi:hypothetical protein